jgi:hypothetical protein
MGYPVEEATLNAENDRIRLETKEDNEIKDIL